MGGSPPPPTQSSGRERSPRWRPSPRADEQDSLRGRPPPGNTGAKKLDEKRHFASFFFISDRLHVAALPDCIRSQSLTCFDLLRKHNHVFPAWGALPECVQSAGIISSVSLPRAAARGVTHHQQQRECGVNKYWFQCANSGCLKKHIINPSCHYHHYYQHSEGK